MSTLLEIKQAAANYLNIAIADLTQNGQDLFILAANSARKMAELANDFEFSRKVVSVTVNGSTGGSLAMARDEDNNLVEVKTVVEAGLLDSSGNLCPVEWTTTAESLTRQREDNMGAWPRYPRDGESEERPFGGMRFTFSGDKVSKWPRLEASDPTDYPLFLEAYTFYSDWDSEDLFADTLTITGTLVPNVVGVYNKVGTDIDGEFIFLKVGAPTSIVTFNQGTGQIDLAQVNDPDALWSAGSYNGTYNPAGTATGVGTGVLGGDPVSDIWTTHGQKYILWASIVQLNHLWKRFVPRTEGNLPPPQALADDGLASLIAWDAYKYEGFRTHNR